MKQESCDFSHERFNINIPYNKKVLEVIGNENVHQNVHQKSDVEIITSLIKNDNKVTLKEMAISINKSVKTVQRIINECGNIKYVGSSKSGHWEIVD